MIKFGLKPAMAMSLAKLMGREVIGHFEKAV